MTSIVTNVSLEQLKSYYGSTWSDRVSLAYQSVTDKLDYADSLFYSELPGYSTSYSNNPSGTSYQVTYTPSNPGQPVFLISSTGSGFSYSQDGSFNSQDTDFVLNTFSVHSYENTSTTTPLISFSFNGQLVVSGGELVSGQISSLSATAENGASISLTGAMTFNGTTLQGDNINLGISLDSDPATGEPKLVNLNLVTNVNENLVIGDSSSVYTALTLNDSDSGYQLQLTGGSTSLDNLGNVSGNQDIWYWAGLSGNSDSVSASSSFTLPSTFENLTLTGSGDTNGTGNNLNNIIIGNAGHNVLNGGAGNDTLDGGAGNDTAHYTGLLSAYHFSTSGSTTQISSPQSGIDQLSNIESLSFGQAFVTTIALADAVSGAAQTQLAQLTDLYLAFFGRAPDISGIEYWQQQSLGGLKDFAHISADFAWSNEAQQRFPLGSSNQEFVKQIYENSFGREPDSGGWNYWTGVLDQQSGTGNDLNARGAFVGQVILGAYAPTSGDNDRTLLTNRHDVSLYYADQLSLKLSEGFDAGIDQLLTKVNGDAATVSKAEHVIDYAFSQPVTLTGVLNDTSLFNSLWDA